MDAVQWDERYASQELVWGAEPNRFLPPEVSGLAPGRGVDLACGEGRNAIWLARQGWSMTGIDFSAVGIAKARRLAEHAGVVVDLVVDDVTTVALEPVHDLVLIFYVQFAPQRRRAMLERAAGALAPGGTFLMVAHDLSNLTEGIGGPQDPDVLPTADMIVDDLGATSVGGELVVDRAGTVERPIEGGVAIDCLVRAHRTPDPGNERRRR
jgi:SAM-dependent methyltransferase